MLKITIRNISCYMLGLFVCLSFLFVGNFRLAWLPAFFAVWAAVIAFRIVFFPKISDKELTVQILLFIIFFPYLLIGAFNPDYYYFSFLSSIAFVNILPLIVFLVSSKFTRGPIVFLALLSGLVGLSMWSDQRGYFVFGPNILYRIFGFIGIVLVINSMASKEHGMAVRGSLVITYLSLLAIAIAVMSTKSRGGVLVVILLMCVYAFCYSRSFRSRFLIVLIMTVLAWGVYANFEFISILLGRSVSFDIGGDSISTRIDLLEKASEFVESEGVIRLLWGAGYPNQYYPIARLYPHNLFVEILVYHGLYLLSVFFFFSAVMVYMASLNKTMFCIIILFSPIYVGSMVSGYIGDHSYLMSLPLSLVLLKLLKHPCLMVR